MTSYKRINFQLPLSLAREFEAAAKKEGVTKAKLLKEWINEADGIEFGDTSSGHYSTFNFRADIKSLQKLQDLSVKYKCKISLTARSVIITNLSNRSKSITEPTTETRFDTAEQLSISQNAALINEQLKFGHIMKADQLIDLYTDKAKYSKSPQDVFTRVNIFKAQSNLYKKNMLAAEKHLDMAKSSISSGTDTETLLSYYQEKGHFHELADQQEVAVENLMKALSLTNVVDNPQKAIEVYETLGVLFEWKGDPVTSNNFLSRALELSISSQDKFSEGCILVEQSINAMLTGVEPTDTLQKGWALINKFDTPRRKYYTHDALSAQLLLKGNYSKAYESYLETTKLEELFRPGTTFGRTQYIKTFLEARTSYEYSAKKLQAMIDMQIRPNKKELGKYYLNAAQYLLGNTMQRQLGRTNLLKQASEASYNLVKIAAKNTVLQNKLQPVR